MRAAMVIGTLLVTTASGCAQGKAESAGPMIDKSFPVANFRQIGVAGSYQVDVRTGRSPSVTATGPKAEIDRMVVEVKGDRLLIHPRQEQGFRFGGWGSTGVKVHVTAPALVAASVAGSADIRLDRVAGNAFEGSVDGSGNLDIGQLHVARARLSIGGSGDIRAHSGEVGHSDYSIAGSGGIDTRPVRADTASVSITGSGSVDAQAARIADISIIGSGDVTLTGGARCNVSRIGSGNARCS